MKKERIDKLKIMLAILSGFLLTLSFPKTNLSWIAWFFLIPLFAALNNLSPKKSFFIGLITGFAHYLTLVYWLAYTMNTYGNLPLYLSVAVLLLLTAYLALYVAIFSMTLTRLCSSPLSLFIMLPLIWVSLEYIRSFLFTGFPWELVGYTQHNTLPIIQIADILGVYGISFCIALSNAAIFIACLFFIGKTWQGKKVGLGHTLGSTMIFALIFGLIWFYGTWRLEHINKLASGSSSVRVSIVQGNIDQDKKWDPEFQRSTILKYIKLSLRAKKDKPNLVVWPETATPFYFLRNVELSRLVQEGIRATGADFFIGSPAVKFGKETNEHYNSAFLVGPDGSLYGKYDKAHLVPFGEYVPFKKWLPFLGKMVESVGDFHSGKKGQTIQWGKHVVGSQICYEIIFPNLARAMTQNKAELLINITNDAWYGRSSAPYQHFSMAKFRAVENRRSLIRAANTGISGFIDPSGKVIGSTELFQDAVMTANVPTLEIKTFYTRFGDLFAMACLALTLVVVGLKITFSLKTS